MPRVYKCDVCYVRMREEHTWTYEIEPFSIPGAPGKKPYIDDGAWAICPDCHPLVEQRDLDALVERSMMLDRHPDMPEEAERWKRQIIRAFLKARSIRPAYQGALWAPYDGQVRHRG